MAKLYPLGFKQQAFESVVAMIAKESGVLLEIVNFNVQERQYVCAGHVRFTSQFLTSFVC